VYKITGNCVIHERPAGETLNLPHHPPIYRIDFNILYIKEA